MFPVTPAGFARTISWIHRHTDHTKEVLVSMEGTGPFRQVLRQDFQRDELRVVETVRRKMKLPQAWPRPRHPRPKPGPAHGAAQARWRSRGATELRK